MCRGLRVPAGLGPTAFPPAHLVPGNQEEVTCLPGAFKRNHRPRGWLGGALSGAPEGWAAVGQGEGEGLPGRCPPGVLRFWAQGKHHSPQTQPGSWCAPPGLPMPKAPQGRNEKRPEQNHMWVRGSGRHCPGQLGRGFTGAGRPTPTPLLLHARIPSAPPARYHLDPQTVRLGLGLWVL